MTRKISIRLPEELLEEVDALARVEGTVGPPSSQAARRLLDKGDRLAQALA
jgi:metal-responsive CopG/Arc/MetJ family transcriptional regulator